MNESQTRLEKIDPQLHAAGWGVVDDSRILTEVAITRGRISATSKGHPLKADYILRYQGVKLAVVEAKSDEHPVGDGVAQAKEYALKLAIRYTYATNGDTLYFMDLETGEEHEVDRYPTPQELWQMTFGEADEWRDRFNREPLFSNETRQPRYYQEIAINRALAAIAAGRNRILLTLATGTGKTFIAFQIAWKLFQTKWNVAQTGNRPRILFLADRNILANQAFTGFYGFPNDALVRIRPSSIREKGKVPTNGSVFFTIFQTFVSGDGETANFGQYPADFFDLVIIDECHRGGAQDESNWRKILEYFDSAVQIGLTATPRRDANVNTYRYFGKPVYEYSLKEGIQDGFLTPFRHCKMQSNIDDYIYTPEDEIISGEVEEGRTYTEDDFYHGHIVIRQRDMARVQEFMKYIGNDKTLVFCATQNHAAQIRDMINQERHGNPLYAVRVTANDGEQGERYLRDFQDNEKTIPTVLTTSQKLSTGVDALNVRNIVLLRPVNSMIEFKQIIGRGTRLYDGKYYFTIYDFVKAYERFNDPTWDGEPDWTDDPDGEQHPEGEDSPAKPHYYDDEVLPPPSVHEPCPLCGEYPCVCAKPHEEPLEIRLADGKVRKIRHIKTDMFWGADGKPVSVEQFLQSLFGRMPQFFSSQEELLQKWSNPDTREALLNEMEEAGYGREALCSIRTVIDAENSDLLDVLEYVAYNIEPIAREERAEKVHAYASTLSADQQDFVRFVVGLYVQTGIDELRSEKLGDIMKMKYGSVPDGVQKLGGIQAARNTFVDFQKNLYLN